MLYRLREKFARFMAGRYGNDELNKFLIVLFFILFIVDLFLNNAMLSIIELVIIVIMYFRIFSRNIEKRSRENGMYLRAKYRVKSFFTGRRANSGYSQNGYQSGYTSRRTKGPSLSDRLKFKYFTCPFCGQKVRVPRGKGRVEIRCPKCANIFQSRT